MSEPVDQLRGAVAAAEWQALAAGLSEDALYELSQLVLSLADLPAVRAAIVSEVVDAIPEYGDRAVLVACSRVSWENKDAAVRSEGSAS